jgi:lysozyme
MTRRIIDVSHYEDVIDFEKVAGDGIVAIIAKASEGATWVDPAYAKFKDAAEKYQFLWGSYHFGSTADVEAQVDHYLATVQPGETELICLDFEENQTGPSMTLTGARDFVTVMKQRVGRYPVLYGGGWLKQQLNGKADDVLRRCPLWLSQYSSKPVLPPGWRKYVLWQYTDGESGPEPHAVNGIGPCDRNHYNGSVAQLRKAWPFIGRRVYA